MTHLLRFLWVIGKTLVIVVTAPLWLFAAGTVILAFFLWDGFFETWEKTR